MTSDQITPQLKQRNPITYEAHRRQSFWQIYFPLIIFAVLVIFTIIVAVLAENEEASKWADISLIFMISISLVVFAVVIVGLVYAAIYFRRLIKATPYFFFNVQRFTYMMEIRVKKGASIVVEPILRLNSFFAGARALRRK